MKYLWLFLFVCGVVSCGQDGESERDVPNDTPSTRTTDRLETIRKRVARADFMKPVLMAVYDPRTGDLRDPGTSDYVRAATRSTSAMSTEQLMTFQANRERLTNRLAQSEQEKRWMEKYLESLLREMRAGPSKEGSVVLLKSKCGLSEDDAWLFVGGR